MIQITPQMRILVASEPADFRKGIDGLARVCKEVLKQDPFSGWVFVFRNRPATALKVLIYDGQGFWLCHKRLSSGRFRWWPEKPTIVEFEMDKLQEVLRRAEGVLRAEDYEMLRTLADAYAYLTELVGNKDTTIRRLRQMLFGVKTEKTSAVVGDARNEETSPPAGERAMPRASSPASEDVQSADGEAGADANPEAGVAAEGRKDSTVRGKNHGRNGAAAYTGAEKIEVRHTSLEPGDPCPECAEGTVYETGRPGVLVRLMGQAPVGAQVYYLQKLRCGLCGKLFKAQPPQGVGGEDGEKYDATVGSMIALMKYGHGMPFHRMENLQASVGMPRAARVAPRGMVFHVLNCQHSRDCPPCSSRLNIACKQAMPHSTALDAVDNGIAALTFCDVPILSH